MLDSAFPKMGDDLAHNVMNMSGNRSPYTTTINKKTQGRGSSPTGRAVVRGRTMINEAHGPQFHVSAKLYDQNAAEASETQRNTYMIRCAVPREDRVGSASDFWAKRQYRQNA